MAEIPRSEAAVPRLPGPRRADAGPAATAPGAVRCWVRAFTLSALAILAVAAVPGRTPAGEVSPPDEGSPPAYTVVAGDSYVLAVTDKAGLLGAFGHRHAILGTDVEGVVCFDPSAPERTVARVRVSTASLVVDGARGRELAGLEGGGPKPSDVEEIQADMLSERYLAADAHPYIGFRLATVLGLGGGRWRARGPFSLRGVERSVTVPVELEHAAGGTLVLRGRFTVRQTDYGFEPASVGGVVKVADPVEVRVHLVARPGGAGCPAP
jgi:polyisoprenoid-binding protein YceI